MGVQPPPGVQVFPLVQLAWRTSVHSPVAPLQHAPWGCTHGLGAQRPPWVQERPLAQLACVTTAHAPVVGLQHDPVGCEQGFGEHEPARVHVLPPAQLAWATSVQAPVAALQQAPCGCGQGLGEQTAPGVNVPDVHSTSSTAEHDPEGAQHAPGVPARKVAPVTLTWLAGTLALTAPHEPLLNEKWSKVCAPELARETVTVRPVNTVRVYLNL